MNECDHLIGLTEIDGSFYMVHQSDCVSLPPIIFGYCPKCGGKLVTFSKLSTQHEQEAMRE